MPVVQGVDQSAVHQCLHQRTCLESRHQRPRGICAKETKQFKRERRVGLITNAYTAADVQRRGQGWAWGANPQNSPLKNHGPYSPQTENS